MYANIMDIGIWYSKQQLCLFNIQMNYQLNFYLIRQAEKEQDEHRLNAQENDESALREVFDDGSN